MTDKSIHIVGAGGHARVVAATAVASGWTIAAFWDDREAAWGTTIDGVLVRGPIAELASKHNECAVIAIGSNRVRQRLALRLSELEFPVIIHPFSWQAPDAKIGNGSVVFAGSVIQPGTVIGNHCIVNTGASADHDNVLGDFVQICPGVHLAGTVTIGEGSLLGTGASVIPGIRIGEWVTVGAGSAVIRDLPQNVVAVGVPARIVKGI